MSNFFVKLNHLALGTLLDEFLRSEAVGERGKGEEITCQLTQLP